MAGLRKSINFIVIVICLVVVCYFLYGRLGKPAINDIRDGIVQPASSHNTLTKQTIIESTNTEREAHGLPELNENDLLNQIAESRARDLLEKQYFAHVSPTGRQASDVAQEVGYPYKIIAENLAQGYFPTGKKMVDGWMQSPGHRKNILNPDIKEIGISILKGTMHGQDTTIGVQIFGLESPPVASKTCPQPSESLQREIEAKKGEIDVLRDRLSRIKEELEEEKQAIETSRNSSGSNTEDIQNLNIKIKTYNEKSQWHNRISADMNAKASVLQSMVDEYNRTVRDYQNCRDSSNQN
jgi:hypothetical protein